MVVFGQVFSLVTVDLALVLVATGTEVESVVLDLWVVWLDTWVVVDQRPCCCCSNSMEVEQVSVSAWEMAWHPLE